MQCADNQEQIYYADSQMNTLGTVMMIVAVTYIYPSVMEKW